MRFSVEKGILDSCGDRQLWGLGLEEKGTLVNTESHSSNFPGLGLLEMLLREKAVSTGC